MSYVNDFTTTASETATPVAAPEQTSAAQTLTLQTLTLSPFYHSAVNAVTEPNRFVGCSHYFVTRWMPILGNEGTRIVLALRSLGYYNSKTGERRDHIPIGRAELADRAGCSERTLIREMSVDSATGQPHNWALSQFVQRKTVLRRNPKTGRVWQEINQYQVSMDDPVHPDDWPQVDEYVRKREAEKGPVKGNVQDNSPARQNGTPGPSPARHFVQDHGHSVIDFGQSGTASGQNGAPPQSLHLKQLEKTTTDTAPPPGLPATSPASAPPSTSEPPAMTEPDSSVVVALVKCGVREGHAVQLVQKHGAARCHAAVTEGRRKKRENLVGWICACLAGGWEVGKENATEDALFRALTPLSITPEKVQQAVQRFGTAPVREYLHKRIASYRAEYVPRTHIIAQLCQMVDALP